MDDPYETEELRDVTDTLKSAVEAEARRRNEWIERQVWTTDYSEVAVLDVVTYRPRNPTQVRAGDIKAYRYPTEAECPDDESYYSEQSGMPTEVRRVTRDEFLRIVEDNALDPPPFIEEAEVWDGPLGADADTSLSGDADEQEEE